MIDNLKEKLKVYSDLKFDNDSLTLDEISRIHDIIEMGKQIGLLVSCYFELIDREIVKLKTLNKEV